ncbi:uncharacterized protein LOC128217429 [Mya arenaria]|uniref:uncharacterized protein LOC128217429 n=1 Tax=Mya arenaria TaxID=6604 RepID=UPI0022E3203A|nr:uncharacterized protein LOC128217429 [Mya arenaria]
MGSQKDEKLSQFVESKIRIWYRMHNKKGTGLMSKSEYKEMADTFIREFRLESEEADEIQKWLVDGWAALVEYVGNMDKKAGSSGPLARDQILTAVQVATAVATDMNVTEDMYIRAYGEILRLKPCPFPIYFSLMVETFFDIFDGDKDGFITVDEMVKGLACFGFTDTDRVKAVFKDLTMDSSDSLDRKTYVDAWLEFVQGNDREAAMAKHFTPEMVNERM